MKNGQLQEYLRSLQGDGCWVCWLVTPPDQAGPVQQDGRSLRLSQALIPKLIPKESKEGP